MEELFEFGAYLVKGRFPGYVRSLLPLMAPTYLGGRCVLCVGHARECVMLLHSCTDLSNESFRCQTVGIPAPGVLLDVSYPLDDFSSYPKILVTTLVDALQNRPNLI
jgi:hypothetical protein